MDWAARLLGAFYIFAGLMALKQAVFNWRLERTFGALFPAPPAERAADAILAIGAVTVLVSGLALAGLSHWSVPAFLTAWTVQAGYLTWAQRWYRPLTEDAAQGRRQTVHAFGLYTLAVAAVMAWEHAGVLD